MSKAERSREQHEAYKENFVSAFQILRDQGRGWLAPGEVTPVAASQHEGYMRERRIKRLILGARRETELPRGLEYPPRVGPGPFLAELVEEGVLERMEQQAVASGVVTHPKYLAPVNDGFLYRLVPEEPVAEPQLGVAITA